MQHPGIQFCRSLKCTPFWKSCAEIKATACPSADFRRFLLCKGLPYWKPKCSLLRKVLHRASSKTIAAATAVLACWAPAAIAQTHADGTAPQHLAVVVLDESKLPVPDARVEVKSGDYLIAAASTNDTGNAEFRCEPGRYSVRASKQGFETVVVQEFECKEVAQAPMELTLKAAANKQTVEVHDTLSATEVSSVPTATPITTVNSGAKVLDAAVANKIQPATKAAAASQVLRRMTRNTKNQKHNPITIAELSMGIADNAAARGRTFR